MTAGNILSGLGLVSPSPGTDSRMKVNGRTLVSQPGVVSQDSGRLVLDHQAGFGETLPLRVVEAMERLETTLSDVLTGYNELRSFVLANANLLDQGFADKWRDPLTKNAAGLEWLGIQEWGDKKLLTLAVDEFYTALGANPLKAQALLDNISTGLIPAWKKITESVLSRGTDAPLKPNSSIVNEFLDSSPRLEIDLERKNKLLDLLG